MAKKKSDGLFSILKNASDNEHEEGFLKKRILEFLSCHIEHREKCQKIFASIFIEAEMKNSFKKIIQSDSQSDFAFNS